MLDLEIGGVVFPQRYLAITQKYAKLSARSTKRLANGTAIRRESWADKIRTSISVTDVEMSGFEGIDFSDSLVIKCVAPLAITEADTSIDIPAERRTDTGSDPFGQAYVPNTGWVDTPVSMSVNTATLTSVSGATLYRVFYYPEFTAFFNEPEQSASGGRETSWTITGQQV